MNWETIEFSSAYFLLFACALFAIFWWNRKRRNRRSPFKTETRLLRLPGESLLKRIEELDDALEPRAIFAAAVPLLIGWGCLVLLRSLTGWWLIGALAGAAFIFASSFVLSARWIAQKLDERTNHKLGWYGERVVGDALAPLERVGWRIFHDFPREEGGSKFNIDHIAVGPAGIFAIETKTPRKGVAEAGHKMTFDGDFIRTPSGWKNREWIDQSLRNATWLKKWLRERTGEPYEVEGVLTFPDWYVSEPSPSPPLVLSSSRLVFRFTNRPEILSAKQIDQVSRLIEGVCRDVAY